jgi:predicted CoA-binding protein
MKKTVIVGATTNTSRYAYMAAERLTEHNIEIVPVGIKVGEVFGAPILSIKEHPVIPDVDTITLYIGPRHQPPYYDYLLSLHPNRIIFNPGTENTELMGLVESKGIEVVEGCTLVMLSVGTY